MEPSILYMIIFCLPTAVFCQTTVCNKEDCNDINQDVDKYDAVLTELRLLNDKVDANKEETNARFQRITTEFFVNIAQGRLHFSPVFTRVIRITQQRRL